MKLKILCAFLFLSIGIAKSQVIDSLVPSPLIIPPQYAKFYDSAETVFLPKDFQCTLFYTKANWTPRMLAIDPSGKISVADLQNSEVLALPDNDHDNAADTAIRIAYNTGNAHSIAFYKEALYTAASTYVLKYEHPDANGLYTDSSVFIADIPNTREGEDNHFTRTILTYT